MTTSRIPKGISQNATVALVLAGSAAILVSCVGGMGIGAAGADSPKVSISPSPSPSPSPYPSPIYITVTVAPPSIAPLVGAPKAPAAKPPAPKPKPKPAAPKPPPEPESAYYANCSAARAAGAAPLYLGDPGYRAGLDRDGDGVACE